MKKKTIISILLCACLMASVTSAGCSKADSASQNSSKTSVSSSAVSTAQSQSQSQADEVDTVFQQDGRITIDNIRSQVVGVNEPIKLKDGTERSLINFDNAATTPALQPVEDAVNEELKMYGSIGRGFSAKSNHSTRSGRR